jgi:hypothetical protein
MPICMSRGYVGEAVFGYAPHAAVMKRHRRSAKGEQNAAFCNISIYKCFSLVPRCSGPLRWRNRVCGFIRAVCPQDFGRSVPAFYHWAVRTSQGPQQWYRLYLMVLRREMRGRVGHLVIAIDHPARVRGQHISAVLRWAQSRDLAVHIYYLNSPRRRRRSMLCSKDRRNL